MDAVYQQYTEEGEGKKEERPFYSQAKPQSDALVGHRLALAPSSD